MVSELVYWTLPVPARPGTVWFQPDRGSALTPDSLGTRHTLPAFHLRSKPVVRERQPLCLHRQNRQAGNSTGCRQQLWPELALAALRPSVAAQLAQRRLVNDLHPELLRFGQLRGSIRRHS